MGRGSLVCLGRIILQIEVLTQVATLGLKALGGNDIVIGNRILDIKYRR